MPTSTEAVNQLLHYCHLVHAKGLVSGSGGNVSLRHEDEILITPTGRSLQLLTPDDIVFLNKDGSYHSPSGQKPSKEWLMHLDCYRYHGVNAVIHVHSVNAVAVSCLDALDQLCTMPVYTPGYAIRVGKLPLVPYYTPGSKELAEAVAEALVNRNSAMMANHGIIAVGDSLEKALNITEEMEENAKLYFILNGRGHALTEQQLQGFAMGKRELKSF